MFRRFPGGQGAGQGAGQVSEAQADANYAKLLAGGEEMRGRDGLMVSQVGDRPKVDLSADEAAEQLLRRGDYYAHSPDGTGSSIFSKRRREQIRDQSLTKDRYFAPELAERMGLDPSTRFALKEQGEDGLVDTAYAKSAQRQEMLGERTGRLTQDAKAILKAAGVPTAGVRGKKKIEEAWMKYRENMAKGAPEARESGDPLMTKDGAPDTMAAESRLNAYGNARATTDKGRRARATAAQITGDPSVNIAEMEPTELVLNFMTNLPNATQEQFNMLHEMFRLHHMADSGKAESKRWDYGIITPSFLGSRLGDKAGEIRTILQEIQQIPETDKKALEDARKRWAEITKDYRATPASPPYTAPGLGVVLGS
jgi:hypothetical protein